MARDIIISAFASGSFQPLGEFEDSPLLIGVDGLGSDQYMASFDTERKPREPWGGTPFTRELEKYKKIGAGSIIQGLLKNFAAGVEPRRIAAVAFSAGNTFLSGLLNSAVDAELIDTVISLDGMVYQKDYRGKPVGFDNWLRFGRRACGVDRMGTVNNPYLGPLMVVSHTHIVSAAPKLVSSTNEAAEYLFANINPAYWAAANQLPKSQLDAQGVKQQEVITRLKAALGRVPLPLTIKGGNPPTTKKWDTLWPGTVSYLGNMWALDWGGTEGPDHIFQAHEAQQALFRSYLVPRWNARSKDVAGLGAFGVSGPLGADVRQEGSVAWTSPVAQPGGGIVVPGSVDTGFPWLKLGMVAVGSAAAGALAVGALRRRG